MEEYQARVISEKSDLDQKIVRLSSFIHSNRLNTADWEERFRLDRQLAIMMEYSKVLRNRIENFLQ